MVAFQSFSNPWSCRFQGAARNSILSTREIDQRAGFLYIWKKEHLFIFTSRHQSSLNSNKSLKCLIPVPTTIYLI